MGLLYLFASVVVLFDLVPQPELSGRTKIFMDGIAASVYLLPLIKITELLCGVSLVSGYMTPLATVVIAPVTLNIFLYHLSVAPEGLPVAVFLLLGNLFLGFAYFDRYRPLLELR